MRPICVPSTTLSHDIISTRLPTTPAYVTFSGLLFNARCAANYWYIIAPLLYLMNVNIIAITETWFSPDDDFSVYELQGFSQFLNAVMVNVVVV